LAEKHGAAGRATHAATRVVLPVVLLLMVVAVLVGLVVGGVIQGDAERVGPEIPSSTLSTIVIEP